MPWATINVQSKISFAMPLHVNLRCLFLAVALTVAATPGETAPAVKQVLMLQSLHRGNLVLDRFNGNFRVSLDQLAGKPVNVVEVTVGPAGFVGAPEQAVVDYIRSMYVDRAPPDLVMTAGGPAAAFARKHRRELFPASPLLLASVDQRFVQGAPLARNEAAVTVTNDFPRVIDDMLQVLPETRNVFLVNGSGVLGQFWHRQLETGFARFGDRLAFIWSDELSLQDILHRVANLPAQSAIVYITFGTDVQGGAYADEQVLADLHASANAPMFAAFSPLLGYGVVGGSMMSVDDLARDTADVANRILNGEPAANFRPAPRSPSAPSFDWRELRRWGIPESRLPAGSVVRFRDPDLWDEYRAAVLTTLGVLALQSLMIAWLLYERRARRRAEIDSRRSLAMAADANRRETISALSTSIGHELGQPLASIVHNVQALRAMARSARASPVASGEILDDIQAEAVLATSIIERHRTMLRGHELQRKPVDLHTVIDECLALVAHDLRARKIAAALDLAPTPCMVDGDAVLLGQVLVNLVRNAMDAVADMPATRRHIAIRSALRPETVEVSVRDSGTGLPEAIVATLFTPFVTTKPHGLGIGLPIVQRIVDAHDGTIVARDNPQGGAIFIITLPRLGDR